MIPALFSLFFNSSLRSDRKAFSFELGKGHVINCWDLGFKQMRKGEKAFLTCAAKYAYAERAQKGIPPNSPLRFEVELVDIGPASPERDRGEL